MIAAAQFSTHSCLAGATEHWKHSQQHFNAARSHMVEGEDSDSAAVLPPCLPQPTPINPPPPLPLSGLHRSAGQEDARVRLGAKVLCRYGRLAGQLPPTFVMSRSRAQHTRCNRRPTRRTTAAPPPMPAATHSSCCTRCTARRVLPCRLYAAAAARCLHVVDACLQSSLRSWTLELEVLAAVLQ